MHNPAKASKKMHESVKVPRIPDCDICKSAGETAVAVVDGKTTFGPWANMCEPHFAQHGVGLGTGRGQMLILAD